MILRGRTMFAPTIAGRRRRRPLQNTPKSHRPPKEKTKSSPAFSFAIAAAKEKAIKKKTPEEDFALCGARQRLRAFEPASLPKGLT